MSQIDKVSVITFWVAKQLILLHQPQSNSPWFWETGKKKWLGLERRKRIIDPEILYPSLFFLKTYVLQDVRLRYLNLLQTINHCSTC